MQSTVWEDSSVICRATVKHVYFASIKFSRFVILTHANFWNCPSPRVRMLGPGHPSSPLVHLLPHFSPFYFSLSFIGFTYFLLLSIPSLSTRIVPLRFQAGGRRKWPNLGLVCVLCVICVICIP